MVRALLIYLAVVPLFLVASCLDQPPAEMGCAESSCEGTSGSVPETETTSLRPRDQLNWPGWEERDRSSSTYDDEPGESEPEWDDRPGEEEPEWDDRPGEEEPDMGGHDSDEEGDADAGGGDSSNDFGGDQDAEDSGDESEDPETDDGRPDSRVDLEVDEPEVGADTGEADESPDSGTSDSVFDTEFDGDSDSSHEPDLTDLDTVSDADLPPDSCEAVELLNSVLSYNVFVYGDYVSGHSDAEGRIAAGGDITVWNYSVGLLTPGGTTTVAGGSVTAWNASFHGDIMAGSEIHLTNSDLALPTGGSGSLRYGEPLDFAAIQEAVQLASQRLAELEANGETDVTSWDAIRMSGSSNSVNVFEVEGSALARAVSLEIDVPHGSSVLINISGSTARFSNFAVFSDAVGPEHLLFNAPDCRSIEIEAFGFVGSLLAPYANLDFNNGQFNGSLFAYEFIGDGLDDSLPDGQFNHRPLASDFCAPK